MEKYGVAWLPLSTAPVGKVIKVRLPDGHETYAYRSEDELPAWRTMEHRIVFPEKWSPE